MVRPTDLPINWSSGLWVGAEVLEVTKPSAKLKLFFQNYFGLVCACVCACMVGA